MSADAGVPAAPEPANAPMVDLHAHSTASDGSYAPAAVLDAAQRAGLRAIALTDHDTLAGVAEAARAASAVGIRLIPGVELSVHEEDRELHLLGLHIRDVEMLQEELTLVRERRTERAATIVEKLNALGVVLRFEDVLAEAAGGAVGRPHVARALVARGTVRDTREAFDRFLGAGKAAYVEKARLEVAEGIALVHRAGGITVAAHLAAAGTRERIEALAALGLDGVEVRHPSHSAEDTKRLAALAAHFGLVLSGGSDWHGAAGGPRALGAMKVPMAWLEAQDARVAERRAGVAGGVA